MKRRLKIYFIHSNKIDYKNLIYRDILSSSVCIKHELMLPQTKSYQDKYIKDLINTADIIIIDISKPSFGFNLEVKWAIKSKKPIKFISLNNIIPKKYRKIIKEIEMITEDRSYIKIIEDFIQYYSGKTIEELNDPTIVLGELGSTTSTEENV